MTTIRRIWLIMVREWRVLTSRKLYLTMMVIAPLFCTLFFLTLMKEGLPTEIPVAVVDRDQTAISRRLTRQLDAFKQTRVVVKCKDFSEARELMQKGKVYGTYYLPSGLEHDILSFRQPKVSFYTNNSFIIAGSMLFRDMKTLSILGSAAVNREFKLAHGETMDQAMAELQPIAIDTHALGNPQVSYAIYLSNTILPGILCVIIVILTIYALGAEVKRKSARALVRLAENDMFSLLVGKIGLHTLIYFLVITCIDTILYGYLGFPCKNGLASMLVVSYLFVLASQSLGIFLYAMVPIMRISLSFGAFLTMLSFSISGFTFPVTEMHPLFAIWANVFPLRHLFLLYVDNGLNGYPFAYSWVSYLWLTAFLFLPILTSGRLRTVYKKYVYQP